MEGAWNFIVGWSMEQLRLGNRIAMETIMIVMIVRMDDSLNYDSAFDLAVVRLTHIGAVSCIIAECDRIQYRMLSSVQPSEYFF